MEALAQALHLDVAALADDTVGSKLDKFVMRRDPFGFGPDDPVRAIKTRVGDRWSSLILQALDAHTMGHAQLRRVVSALSSEGKISQRMLTLRLRALERDGIVQRDVTPSVPPRVDYSLTALGREMLEQLMTLIGWVEANQAKILEARAKYVADSEPDIPGRW